MTVEGEKDDISAPGQCYAALALCTGLKDNKKSSYVEPDAGHYGIFAGRYWRNNIRPLVLGTMEKIQTSSTWRKIKNAINHSLGSLGKL